MSTEISPGIFGSLVSYSSLWLLNDLVLAVFSSFGYDHVWLVWLVGCPCDIVPLNLGMASFEVIVAVMASTFSRQGQQPADHLNSRKPFQVLEGQETLRSIPRRRPTRDIPRAFAVLGGQTSHIL